jgi:hypothetical protein
MRRAITRALLACGGIPALLSAQTGRGPYARIAVLRPHDGKTVDFEAGYIRHLEWHRQVRDPWTWYGWTVWAGERQRWFIYATFGHSAGAFDSSVAPAADERDNIVNVTPHAQFVGNGVYEFLPPLSLGNGTPQPTARHELTTVELVPGTAQAFEDALRVSQPTLKGETLWYRLIAGGTAPRYVRLRPRHSLAEILTTAAEQPLSNAVSRFVARVTVEVLTLRPAMSYELNAAPRD